MSLYKEAAVKKKAEKNPRGRPKKKKPTMNFGRGHCGEMNKQGKFKKCGLASASPRTDLYCEKCKRYYHLECFFKAHYCRLMQ